MNYLFKIKPISILLVLFLLFISCQEKKSILEKQKKSILENQKKPVFELVDVKASGVEFVNTLTYSDSLSSLEFININNGGGVAAADFDNDGLQDIYLVGNMTSSRLYKNLGDWKFEDLTEETGAGTTNWSNGVAVVDINQDGYQDIYVCRGGPNESDQTRRANLLFINTTPEKCTLTFEEQAAKWGLADIGYSIQSTFFDYDLDGDLDVYLLSNNLPKYFNPNTLRGANRLGKRGLPLDKLLRNNGDKTFTDVSATARIIYEGFGLGVEICDINTDGWPDIYVSNDFLTDDILYINQQDGTFKNKNSDYFKHFSYHSMGIDIGDINNDGHMDVVVLDMLEPDIKRRKLSFIGNNYDFYEKNIKNGYQPQYPRNVLQLNNGNGSFSEVGQIAGISATGWSWSPLLFDYDNDGLKDLCITNGYPQDILNLDFIMHQQLILTMGPTEKSIREYLIKSLKAPPSINFLYKNQGNFTFDDVSEDVGFTKATYSNGMAYADFDNDGDLDLVMNNLNEPASLLRNTTNELEEVNYIKFKFEGAAPNKDGIGSQVEILYQGAIQKQYFTPYRGYLSTVENSVHFGIGRTSEIDSVVVTWPDGKVQLLQKVAANQEIILRHSEAKKVEALVPSQEQKTLFQSLDSTGLEIAHMENSFVDYKVQALLPHMHSRNGPGLAVADVNADGFEDVYIGAAKGQSAHLLLQQSNGTFKKNQFLDSEYEDMGTLFFDADNDGDQDLYVVSGGSAEALGNSTYQDRLYQNNGKGIFIITQALPVSSVSGSAVAASDYDKDGDLDLFVGGRVRPGDYPMPSSSTLLKNISTKENIRFENDSQAVNGIFKTLGMVTDVLWTDFNNDSWQDLIVVGEFMQIRIFENQQGTLKEITNSTGLQNTSGWWNSITGGDFDNDGDIDYVLGNLGLNVMYKVSALEPLRIHAYDYDKNGQIDPLMSHYFEGENHLIHARSDLINQVNSMRARFLTYSDYSNRTLEESLRKDEIAAAHIIKSETFANSYMENLGEGKFQLSQLPRTAQIAPMYGMLVNDYTGDGNIDVLSVGNFYSGDSFLGRYDASIGWLLQGNGKGGFNALDVAKSGFHVEGDAKGMVQMIVANEQLTLVGMNNGPLKVFKKAIENSVYIPKADEQSALIKYKDGSIRKVEFYYGGSYLSHSGRSLLIPAQAVSVLVSNSKGEQTEILPLQ